MIFLENKYKKWYFNIIDAAKINGRVGYIEKHHIIPKSLGGSDSKDNLVNLTAREHFLCHLLLIKCTSGYDKKLMLFALGKFVQNAPGQYRILTSWEYSKARESISNARTGRQHSEETKKKMSENRKGKIPWNKGKSVGPCTEEKKMLLSNYWKSKPKSESHAKNISKGKLGHTSGMTGKQHSEETKRKLSSRIVTNEQREKISKSKIGKKFSEDHLKKLSDINKINGAKKKGISKPKTTCPHCGKVGGNSLMTRYHFDNCKTMKNINKGD